MKLHQHSGVKERLHCYVNMCISGDNFALFCIYTLALALALACACAWVRNRR
jgi:hypothetical protein